ncbi:SHOCT domain-containing protein [Streptomyces sp. NPDC048191]
MTEKIGRLKQPADLKAEGILTDEEFESQKRLLLS